MTRIALSLAAVVVLASTGCTDDALDRSGAPDVPDAVGSRKLDVELEFATDGVTVTLRNEPAQVIFDSMVHAATFAINHSGSTMIVTGAAVTCSSGAPNATCTVRARHAGETATGWFFYDFGTVTAPRAIASALALMPGALSSPEASDEFQVGRVRCSSVGSPSEDAPDFCDILATK